MDLMAISFFPDFKKHPAEGAVYLEQTGSLQFKPHELPVNGLGRWLVMDVNNYNNDGSPDIALGNFAFDRGGKPDPNASQKSAPLIILENVVDKLKQKAFR